jgi:hypothetical protein
MQAWNLSILNRTGEARENRRKTGRMIAADATCSLGTVIDISSGGARVRRRGPSPVQVGDQFIIELEVAEAKFTLPVEVRRIVKVGWRTHDYGLRFGEIPEAARQQFSWLARMAAPGRSYE